MPSGGHLRATIAGGAVASLAAATLAAYLWQTQRKRSAAAAAAATAAAQRGHAPYIRERSEVSKRMSATDPRHHHYAEYVMGGRAALPRPHQKSFDGESKFSTRGGAYVYRLVLTGGPCAGKSSAISRLSHALRTSGFDVYCCPEVPTILLNGGCKFPGEHAGSLAMDFEAGLLQLQLQMERSFIKIAQATHRPSVVLMDRGLLDVAAYLPVDKWRSLLSLHGLDTDYLLGRYDMVLHLTTAADGAEEHFRGSGSPAALTSARDLDRRMGDVWRHHPARHVLDNSVSFDDKLGRATKLALDLVAAPGLRFLTT
jgi:hypothetical protein